MGAPMLKSANNETQRDYPNAIQGGNTQALTVGRSATAVKA